MTWLAFTLAAGIYFSRCFPHLHLVAYAFLVFSVAIIIYQTLRLLRTDTSDEFPENPDPLFPRQRFLARFGVDKALLAVGCLLFAVGFLLSRAVSVQLDLDKSAIPERFYAEVEILEPPEEGFGLDEEGYWQRALGLILSIDGVKIRPIKVRLAGKGEINFQRSDVLTGFVKRKATPLSPWPGGFDFGRFLETRRCAGAVVFQKAKGDAVAYKISTDNHLSWRVYVDQVRRNASRRLLRVFPDERGDFLAAAIFGYRVGLEHDTEEIFRRVGIGHLLAISGLHVGLIVGLAWWVLSLLIRDRRRLAALCIVITICYLGLSGGRVAAVRATVMTVVYLSGFVLARRSDFTNSLGLAAGLILLENPLALIDIGFQLSFVAVLFISRIGGEFSRWRKTREYKTGREDQSFYQRWGMKFCRAVAGGFFLSLTGWLATWPLGALNFCLVSFAGLWVNVIALPLMSLVLAGGVLAQALEPLSATLAGWCGLPAELMLRLAEWAADFPGGAVAVSPPDANAVLGYYLCAAALFSLRMLPAGKIRYAGGTLAGLGLAVATAIMITGMTPKPQSGIYLVPGLYSEIVVVEKASGEVTAIGRAGRDGVQLERFLKSRAVKSLSCLADMTWNGEEKDLSVLARSVELKSRQTIALQKPPEKDVWDRCEWFSLQNDKEIELALSRDDKGNLIWWAVRYGGMTVGVSEWCWGRQMSYRLRKNFPGTDADAVSLRVRGEKSELAVAEKFASSLVLTGHDAKNPPRKNIIPRDAFGAIHLAKDKNGTIAIKGFDGREWREIRP